jgi:serine/threonine protein kinase
MSPEMMRGRAYGKGFANDVWGLGCILFELMTGNFMWEMDSVLGAMAMESTNFGEEVAECIGPNFSKQSISLIRRLLSPDPRNRPTLAFLLRKQYMAKWAPAPTGHARHHKPKRKKGRR